MAFYYQAVTQLPSYLGDNGGTDQDPNGGVGNTGFSFNLSDVLF